MYHVVYGILWLLSLLPLRVLYVFADFCYVLIFYVFRYRRDIVMSNLLHAFPEKTERERYVIAKKFYHNLIDTFIETIKLITASARFLDKRFTANWELVNQLKSSGRKVQLHLGHNFNWEWANATGARHLQYPFIVVYMPLTSKIFDRIFYQLRSRSGTLLARATNLGPDLMPHRNKQYAITLVADQNPGHPASGLWFNFLGRPAPFLSKPAKNAIINKAAVVFAFIHKKKRGHYELVFSVEEENAGNTTEIDLTRRFVHYIENVIKKYPDMWLWSHRRWKHQWKEEYGEIRD